MAKKMLTNRKRTSETMLGHMKREMARQGRHVERNVVGRNYDNYNTGRNVNITIENSSSVTYFVDHALHNDIMEASTNYSERLVRNASSCA
jgi:hypothetical protein